MIRNADLMYNSGATTHMTRNADLMYGTRPPSPHGSRIILSGWFH